MSALSALVSPEQYALAREGLVRLAQRSDTLREALEGWPFAFTSLAAVSNRSTGVHRDRKSGGNNFYDVMTTIGGDPDVVQIKFPGDWLLCEV